MAKSIWDKWYKYLAKSTDSWNSSNSWLKVMDTWWNSYIKRNELLKKLAKRIVTVEINDGVSPWGDLTGLRCYVWQKKFGNHCPATSSNGGSHLIFKSNSRCRIWNNVQCDSVSVPDKVADSFILGRRMSRPPSTPHASTARCPKAPLSRLILSSLHIPAGWCHPEISPSGSSEYWGQWAVVQPPQRWMTAAKLKLKAE